MLNKSTLLSSCGGFMLDEYAIVFYLELMLEVLPIVTMMVILLSSPESKPRSCWTTAIAFFSFFSLSNLLGLISR